MSLLPLNERGLTLTEVTIVAAIGLLVLLGLGGFYLNSQAIWLDASSQSITQREATLVSEQIAQDVRVSASAQVTNNPDANHVQVALYTRSDPFNAFVYYWWDPADSLVHSGTNPVSGDLGPMLASKVEQFQVIRFANLVETHVRVRSGTGQRLEVVTTGFMRNH